MPYHAKEIELIRRAIDAAGRPIVLSMSPGATPLESREHAKQHANLWRISDDFWDNGPACCRSSNGAETGHRTSAPATGPMPTCCRWGKSSAPERGPRRERLSRTSNTR